MKQIRELPTKKRLNPAQIGNIISEFVGDNVLSEAKAIRPLQSTEIASMAPMSLLIGIHRFLIMHFKPDFRYMIDINDMLTYYGITTKQHYLNALQCKHTQPLHLIDQLFLLHPFNLLRAIAAFPVFAAQTGTTWSSSGVGQNTAAEHKGSILALGYGGEAIGFVPQISSITWTPTGDAITVNSTGELEFTYSGTAYSVKRYFAEINNALSTYIPAPPMITNYDDETDESIIKGHMISPSWGTPWQFTADPTYPDGVYVDPGAALAEIVRSFLGNYAAIMRLTRPIMGISVEVNKYVWFQSLKFTVVGLPPVPSIHFDRPLAYTKFRHTVSFLEGYYGPFGLTGEMVVSSQLPQTLTIYRPIASDRLRDRLTNNWIDNSTRPEAVIPYPSFGDYFTGCVVTLDGMLGQATASRATVSSIDSGAFNAQQTAWTMMHTALPLVLQRININATGPFRMVIPALRVSPIDPNVVVYNPRDMQNTRRDRYFDTEYGSWATSMLTQFSPGVINNYRQILNPGSGPGYLYDTSIQRNFRPHCGTFVAQYENRYRQPSSSAIAGAAIDIDFFD